MEVRTLFASSPHTSSPTNVPKSSNAKPPKLPLNFLNSAQVEEKTCGNNMTRWLKKEREMCSLEELGQTLES